MAESDWTFWAAADLEPNGQGVVNSTLSNAADEAVTGTTSRRHYGNTGGAAARTWRFSNNTAALNDLPLATAIRLRATMRVQQVSGGAPWCAISMRGLAADTEATRDWAGYSLRLMNTGAATLSLILYASRAGTSPATTISTTTGLSKSRWYDVELGVRAVDTGGDFLDVRYRLTKMPSEAESAWIEVGSFFLPASNVAYIYRPLSHPCVEMKTSTPASLNYDYPLIADFKVFV